MHAWRACVFWSSILLATCLAHLAVADDSNYMTISSPDFAQGQPMPKDSAKSGGNHSPQLLIGSVPLNAKTLVLIVDDPDSPSGLWTHWLLWNIQPDAAVIAQGKAPEGAVQGKNSFGNVRYDGPAPPSGTHRYFFHIHALDSKLYVDKGATRGQLEAAMKGHEVGHADFFGTYSASP